MLTEIEKIELRLKEQGARSEKVTMHSGTSSYPVLFSYDENNNLVKKIIIKPSKDDVTEYEYDNKNRIIQEKNTAEIKTYKYYKKSNHGVIVYYEKIDTKCLFDDKLNITILTSTTVTDNKKIVKRWVYDTNGNRTLVWIEKYENDLLVLSKSTDNVITQYEYNERNLLVKRDNKCNSTTYKYNEDGKEIYKKTEYKKNNEFKEVETFYNRAGQKVKEIVSNFNVKENQKENQENRKSISYLYWYDMSGTLVKETSRYVDEYDNIIAHEKEYHYKDGKLDYIATTDKQSYYRTFAYENNK